MRKRLYFKKTVRRMLVATLVCALMSHFAVETHAEEWNKAHESEAEEVWESEAHEERELWDTWSRLDAEEDGTWSQVDAEEEDTWSRMDAPAEEEETGEEFPEETEELSMEASEAMAAVISADAPSAETHYEELLSAESTTGVMQAKAAAPAAVSPQNATVPVAVKGVSISPRSAAMLKGNTQQLTVDFSPANATNRTVTWTSSSKKVATVSATGLVTAKGKGKTTITVQSADGKKKAKCTITVTSPVTGISVNKKSAAINKGKTLSLKANVAPKDAGNKKVTWRSSNPAVATVTSKGKVKGTGRGTATITCTSVEGGFVAGCEVLVKVPVKGVSISKKKATMTQGETLQLSGSVVPADADNRTLIWSSNKKSVATVDQNGLVTAVGKGKATITVKSAEGKKTKKCTITVKPGSGAPPAANNSATGATLRVSDAGNKGGTLDFTPDRMINVCSYGATPNDNTDDTEAINAAIAAFGKDPNYDAVYIPPGTFRIDTMSGGIKIWKNNVNIQMDKNTVLQTIPTTGNAYGVFYISNADRVTINGGTIRGDRSSHTGGEADCGMGILVYRATNLVIANMTITDCYVDGITLGAGMVNNGGQNVAASCDNVKIRNCSISNNRRDNISITGANNVLIDSCVVNDANGKPNQVGILIEPFLMLNTYTACRNITIANCYFKSYQNIKATSRSDRFFLTVATYLIRDSEMKQIAASGTPVNYSTENLTLQNCVIDGDFANYSGKNTRLVNCTVNGTIEHHKSWAVSVPGTKYNRMKLW